MTTELNENELEQVIGGIDKYADDQKRYNVECTMSSGVVSHWKGVHGTEAKDAIVSRMAERNVKCVVTPLN